MSFASDVKEELCRVPIVERSCARAEAYGVLLFCNHFSGGGARVVTESPHFAARLPALFKTAFGVDFDRLPAQEAGKRVFQLNAPTKLAAVWESFGYDPGETLAHHINFAVLEEEGCRSAFFRGAFLAGGAVTDPAKRYHLELATSHYNVSRELTALLREEGFDPKETTRKSNYLTYFKQSQAIGRFLDCIGAPHAGEQVRWVREEKAVLVGVYRRMNCDAANLDKVVDAAQEQIAAIRRLEERGVLDELPDKLKDTAALRVEHPELTLSQLAEASNPPVTKSCLNHRLRKLMELAK